MDFADPKFKGEVVFQSMPASNFGLHGFLMFNHIQGGTDKNVDPGFTKWGSTIGPHVLKYIPSSAELSEMVQTGEAAIFPLTPTAVATQKARGVPMGYAQPKKGSKLLMVAECVTANNDNPALAQKLAEFLLTPNAQSAALEFGNQIPSNLKIQPSTPVAAATVAKFKGYMKTVNTLDRDAVNELRPGSQRAGGFCPITSRHNFRGLGLKCRATAPIPRHVIQRSRNETLPRTRVLCHRHRRCRLVLWRRRRRRQRRQADDRRFRQLVRKRPPA